MTHRRAVPGRRKDFDFLLAEHKGRAKEKEGGQKKEVQAGSQSVQVTQSHDAAPSQSTSCTNGKTTPTLKLRLANSHLHRYVLPTTLIVGLVYFHTKVLTQSFEPLFPVRFRIFALRSKTVKMLLKQSRHVYQYINT